MHILFGQTSMLSGTQMFLHAKHGVDSLFSLSIGPYVASTQTVNVADDHLQRAYRGAAVVGSSRCICTHRILFADATTKYQS